MVDEWPSQDRSREAKWLEFCRRVDEGEFDTEIEMIRQAIKEKIKDEIRRIERPTTPDDLIMAAELQDSLNIDDESPPLPRDLIQDIGRFVEEYESLPEDAKKVMRLVRRRDEFKKDRANFERFLRDLK